LAGFTGVEYSALLLFAKFPLGNPANALFSKSHLSCPAYNNKKLYSRYDRGRGISITAFWLVAAGSNHDNGFITEALADRWLHTNRVVITVVFEALATGPLNIAILGQLKKSKGSTTVKDKCRL
jgi:hypothetical protein